MNIRRGLVRTWIVLTILWIVVMGNNNFGQEVNLADWRVALWILVAPPIGLAILLTALGWIIFGFKGSSPK
jgi:hypothetical protein